MAKANIPEHPILFSTDMVWAILEGRKTCTRRIIKESFNGCLTNGGPHPCPNEPIVFHPGEIIADPMGDGDMVIDWPQVRAIFHCSTLDSEAKCRFGKVGDRLWVKETFWYIDFCGEDNGYVYKASENGQAWADSDEEWTWKPSIFMPKVAARIWLEVVGIKVEAVQDISANDAVDEGIQLLLQSGSQLLENGPLYRDYLKKPELFNEGLKPIDSYASLWSSINGPESWEQNPWVWAIDFKVLSTTGRLTRN